MIDLPPQEVPPPTQIEDVVEVKKEKKDLLPYEMSTKEESSSEMGQTEDAEETSSSLAPPSIALPKESTTFETTASEDQADEASLPVSSEETTQSALVPVTEESEAAPVEKAPETIKSPLLKDTFASNTSEESVTETASADEGQSSTESAEAEETATILPAVESDDKGVIAPVPTLPSEEKDLLAFALSVCDVLEDGFQWSDIGPIMAWSIDYVKRFSALSIEEQKADIKEIFDYVIDNTDTPQLPDGFTDPLFKSLLPPFLDLVFAAFSGELHAEVEPLADPTIAPTVEELKRFAYDICRTFEDGFQFEDLATIVRLAMESLEPFQALTDKQQRDAIVQVVYYVIDITDTPYLPDPWVDPIMKAMTPPFVDFIIEIRKHEELVQQ